MISNSKFLEGLSDDPGAFDSKSLENVAPVDKSEVKVIGNVQLSQNPKTRF